MLEKILLHLRRVCPGEVDLVNSHDYRHAGVLGVRDCLDRLRHHLIVSCYNEHDDIRDLSAARTHSGEGFVARRIEEGDVLAARQRDVVCTDVLGNTTRLTRYDVGLPDVIEERSLAVVDMTHDRDDRRTRL